ncbi:transport permease protein [Sphaerisporangium siamense]|uniref:Transport permease protein n=1 Tax=Sphaerisporangium siamense TaxID=795645 RepID=A0A7W7D507_9ACTN|nr:ABC transporter permease [Sphaerisporangium siamense]MBB4700425.1 teichoic acid transport system permease protein [Sphaerisporangium siamense]GII88413.1 transport permease protein [Sphaerisporangium siamense]
MSQPDSAVADSRAGDRAHGSSQGGKESLSALAERHGLRRAIARPSLPVYLRQLWERRHFVLTYATSRNVSKYSDSILGQLWQVLTPLLNAAVYYLMFGLILGQKNNITNYPAFLITGVFVYGYTQRSITGGAKSISGNLSLIRALHFPRAALPLAYTIQEFQQLAISMGVLAVIVLITGEPLTWMWLLIPVALLLQTIFNIGMSLLLARIGAFVRDMNQLLPFILRTWLYTSGVFYSIPAKMKDNPDWARFLLEFNPPSVFIDLMRHLLLKTYPQDLVQHGFPHSSLPQLWLYAGFWAAVALIGGFWYFWRAEERYGRG